MTHYIWMYHVWISWNQTSQVAIIDLFNPPRPGPGWAVSKALSKHIMTHVMWRDQHWMWFTAFHGFARWNMGSARQDAAFWVWSSDDHVEDLQVLLQICSSHAEAVVWYDCSTYRFSGSLCRASCYCAIDSWQHLTVSLETQSKQETGMFHGAFTLGIQCRIQWGMLEWWQVCPILMLRAAPNMFADQAQSVRGTVMPHDSLGMPSWGHSRDWFLKMKRQEM